MGPASTAETAIPCRRHHPPFRDLPPLGNGIDNQADYSWLYLLSWAGWRQKDCCVGKQEPPTGFHSGTYWMGAT